VEMIDVFDYNNLFGQPSPRFEEENDDEVMTI